MFAYALNIRYYGNEYGIKSRKTSICRSVGVSNMI